MVIRIIIAGESQCDIFAQISLVADHLAQNLPNFCYERIEKPVLEWKSWLCKTNLKNNWHHDGSPLIWKELLMKGSKPYYIGGAPEFLDYCYSYYQLDSFLANIKFEGLVKNFEQYQKKVKHEHLIIKKHEAKKQSVELPVKSQFIVCISGAGHPLAMHLISGLLEMTTGDKSISKIYIYDSDCSQEFMEFVERACSYVETSYSGKIVKFIEKIGVALTQADLFVILDHVPLNVEIGIGDWLHANRKVMEKVALMINASASRKTRILIPNLGPACYNATVLMNYVVNIKKENIVVATSDLGLEILPTVAEIAEVPIRNIFCPPVWGFVGINHLVDIRTTIHKYNTFEPYNRYIRVKNSTLNIGSLTPEMRTLEYLMYFDETLWIKIAEKQKKSPERHIPLNKAAAVLNIVKLWLFDYNSSDIVTLGIRCNGTFGLTFNGAFSQPVRFVNGEWIPARDFMLPKDPQMKLSYLQEIAKMTMNLGKKELPKLVPYFPCVCKVKYCKKKSVW